MNDAQFFGYEEPSLRGIKPVSPEELKEIIVDLFGNMAGSPDCLVYNQFDILADRNNEEVYEDEYTDKAIGVQPMCNLMFISIWTNLETSECVPEFLRVGKFYGVPDRENIDLDAPENFPTLTDATVIVPPPYEDAICAMGEEITNFGYVPFSTLSPTWRFTHLDEWHAV